MSLLKVGVFGTSHKENEKRVPIHPLQLDWIDEKVRKHLFFEEGYGEPFSIEDHEIADKTGGIGSRQELFNNCDIMLIPKPIPQDLEAMPLGRILWGWPHCVQQAEMTQVAIDKKLTLIAFEAMHKWDKNDGWQMHIFQRNNEMAGYAGIMHALSLVGMEGNYGPSRKAVVISFGSVSRGAIIALKAMGFQDISVFTLRNALFVADRMTGVEYFHFEKDENGHLTSLHPARHSYPFIEELVNADLIVNGTLQNTDDPLMFVEKKQIDRLKPGCIIVDISCDEGMGFYFARPTDFNEPIFKEKHVHYYGVDHTPSYFWDSASWEISQSLIPYLPIVMKGEKRWEKSVTIKKAIEIKEGIVQNPKILSFQNRAEDYPHPVLDN